MASYQPTILPAPPQYGFIPGLAQGMSGAGQNYGNAYMEAMIKDKFAKKEAARKQEEMNKFKEAMQQGGFEAESYTTDAEGNLKPTWKKKESPTDIFAKDPQKAIKNAMLGVGTEDVGQTLNIPQPTPMAPDMMSKVFPTAQMTGQQYSSTGGTMDYGQTVKNALMEKFAPGYTPEQVQRDVMGLPIETPENKMQFDKALSDAMAGNITWDKVYRKFPSKSEIIDKVKMSQEMRQEDSINFQSTNRVGKYTFE